ncbi:MAG: hypothetical protein FD139_1091 [Methylocystaceae bacterium]|nr:MAG: hypothetical protein FD148_3035 [Methylocystaceae bacterium]KAF0212920.1 MAG: hypothetical protein FD172_857 [Methylocystaceae bacterium]TXT46282.1 MAG: hypothetical protein FD139_1091 [Methylocystaceae bacterium]
MSSLIFYTDSEQILVATDTLAVDPDGSPMMFSSKAIYLPHLRTIVAGTGIAMFSGDWAMQANNRMVLGGILNLDYHASAILRERWIRYRSEFSLPDDLTTTIYHFGLSEDDSSVCAFAYRSTNDFVSERLPYGFGLKPVCNLPEQGTLIENLPIMMEEQRKQEAGKSKSERLYIGGECIALHLTKEGCRTFSVFKFEDYLDDLQAIFLSH